MLNFKMLISRSLWVWSNPSAASLATAKTSFLKIDGLKAACSCSPFGLLQHLCMWLNWYEKGSTSTSNIDVGLKPGDFYVVTVSHWWIAVEAQGLSCTCVLPRVFQFINPGVSRFIQCRCKSEFSQLRPSHTHLFFCKFLFFFFPPLSAGNPESHPGLFSSCRTGWWFAVSLKPGKFPMEANGAPVAFQRVDFCHFLCKMDSISPWRQKPLFCWVTLQNNRQLQKSWYALFLVPVFTLKFSPVVASFFFFLLDWGFFGLFRVF